MSTSCTEPPILFDPPTFPEDTLNVQGHEVPQRWTESGSYLFDLSLPQITALGRAGRHQFKTRQMCQDLDTIYRVQCKITV